MFFYSFIYISDFVVVLPIGFLISCKSLFLKNKSLFLEIKKKIVFFFFSSGNQELLNESWRITHRITPMLLRTLPNRNLWKFSFLSCLKQTFNQINIYLSLVSLEVPFKSSKNEIR